MKVLLINGSPKVKGNTAFALEQMAEVFAAQGVETEIIQVPTVDGEYYAVTFWLDEHGEYENNAGFEPASEGKHVLPLTYIEDQITFVGTLGRIPVLLDCDAMTLDWETEEYKWL